MTRTPSVFRPGHWRGTLPPDIEAGVIGLSLTDEHGNTHRYALPLSDAWLLRQSLQAVPEWRPEVSQEGGAPFA